MPYPLRFPTLLLLLTGCLAAAAQGYEPPVEEIVRQYLAELPLISRAIIKTESRVFDPFTDAPAPAAAPADVIALPQPGDEVEEEVGADETISAEVPARAFRSTIYWIRNRFLAVETFSMEGQPLHFYIRDGFVPETFALAEERPFTEWDILPAFAPFLEVSPEGWHEGLDRWGVQPAAVGLVRVAKGRIHYRLEESTGKDVWVEREQFLPLRINTILAGGEAPVGLTVEFTDFLILSLGTERPWRFPRVTNYLLDGRLFKQEIVVDLEGDPRWDDFPLTHLRQLASRHRQALAAREVAR